MAGLDTTGFVTKDVDTLLAELEAAEKSAFGNSLNVRPTSVMGVLNGIIATKFSELWDVGNEVWSSQNPDTATGVSLDQICQLTGVTRESAQQSTVTLTLTGTNGTTIPALRRVKNSQTGTYWTNPLSASIGASPTAVPFVSEDYGEIIGLAGTLTVIDTPVSGWTSVTNASDAALGQLGESDAELRVRRAALLTATGKGTIDAIRADVLSVSGVLAVAVFENTTNMTDLTTGLPAKSFEVVVDGGTGTALAQAIWDSKPAGISAYGTTNANAVDAIGGTRVMAYTPVTPKNVYVALTAITGIGFSGATADIASSVVNGYGVNLQLGDDISKNAVVAFSFISGVGDVTDLRLDFFSSPTASSNLPVGIRERGKFDSSRFTVWLA